MFTLLTNQIQNLNRLSSLENLLELGSVWQSKKVLNNLQSLKSNISNLSWYWSNTARWLSGSWPRFERPWKYEVIAWKIKFMCLITASNYWLSHSSTILNASLKTATLGLPKCYIPTWNSYSLTYQGSFLLETSTTDKMFKEPYSANT